MSQKRILIDGYNLALEAGTGVATYGRNLSRRLHEMGHRVEVLYGLPAGGRDPLMLEVSFFDHRETRKRNPVSRWLTSARDWFASTFGVQARAIPISGKVVLDSLADRLPYFDQLWNVPRLFARAQTHHRYFFERQLTVRLPGAAPHIAHWTYPLPLRVEGARNICTLHDLVPVRLPYSTLDVKREYLALAKMLARTADHIVTVSENSRRDIINLLGVPETRVTNTYQAVDIPAEHRDKPDDLVRRQVEGTFRLPYRGYFLFYGAIEPKKNVARLIEAYLSADVPTPLVLVGKEAWLAERDVQMVEEMQKLQEADGSRRIIRLDYVPFSMLVSLIRGAKAVVFPSLYEGFGLPVLESMLLGTPVLTSNTSSLPEVAGDAALCVDPYDTARIAEGIRVLDNNAELRGQLADKGRRQAALFSAEKYRQRLAELYDRLA